MSRSLKVIVVVGSALAALVMLNVGGAQAAEEKFHCSVEPCNLTLKPDGTATTAHHVIVLKGESTSGVKGSSLSITCNELTGEATVSTKTFTEFKIAKPQYKNCKLAGVAIEVDFTSCGYKFTSSGGGTAGGAQLHVECTTAGDGIDIKYSGVTCVKITPLTSQGLNYSHSGTPSQLFTAALANLQIAKASVDLENKLFCAVLFALNNIEEAKYTTGNTNIAPETDPGGVAANMWFE